MTNLVTVFDDGYDHRISRDPRGRFWIWDQSGDSPFDTDDGPFRIKDPIFITSENYRTRLAIGTREGNNIHISAQVAQFLVEEVGFTMEFGEHRYTCACLHVTTTETPGEYGVYCPVCELGIEEAFLEGRITAEDVRGFGLDPEEIKEEVSD